MEQLTVAVVREPGPNFADGQSTAGLGKPDYETALSQHQRYCEVLENCGLHLIRLPADIRYPDGCFVEDTAIIIDDYAVITKPGHPSRRGEQDALIDVLSEHKEIVYIKDPGTIDGGDVLRVGDHYYIGISRRTNLAGAAQLSSILLSLGKTVTTIPLSGLLHLKTGVTCVAADTLVCLPEFLDHEGFSSVGNKIVVSEEEKHAANCLLVNDMILIPGNCPDTKKRLENTGKKVLGMPLSEYQKMDGGLSCLSVRF